MEEVAYPSPNRAVKVKSSVLLVLNHPLNLLSYLNLKDAMSPLGQDTHSTARNYHQLPLEMSVPMLWAGESECKALECKGRTFTQIFSYSWYTKPFFRWLFPFSIHVPVRCVCHAGDADGIPHCLRSGPCCFLAYLKPSMR